MRKNLYEYCLFLAVSQFFHCYFHIISSYPIFSQVDRAEGHQTLFRGNTIASKAMTYSFKIYGSGYLHLLLHPIISEMTKQCGKSYEVDAARYCFCYFRISAFPYPMKQLTLKQRDCCF